jgi:hypothetical protein
MKKSKNQAPVLTKVHQQNGLTFKFLTDEVGEFPVTCIKFVKKGALFVSQPYKLALWVEYLSENEPILQPRRWDNLYLVKDADGPPYIAEAEDEKGNRAITFSSVSKAFIIG